MSTGNPRICRVEFLVIQHDFTHWNLESPSQVNCFFKSLRFSEGIPTHSTEENSEPDLPDKIKDCFRCDALLVNR